MTIYSSSSSSACSELLQSFQRAMKSIVYSNEYLLLLRLLNNCIGRVTYYMRSDRGVISCGKTLFRRLLEENNAALYGNIIASPHSISAYISHTGQYRVQYITRGPWHVALGVFNRGNVIWQKYIKARDNNEIITEYALLQNSLIPIAMLNK